MRLKALHVVGAVSSVRENVLYFSRLKSTITENKHKYADKPNTLYASQ